jgi:hypothetical protein
VSWFSGVTTIAGGKSVRGGHVDGPSDEAKFSTDFEVRYIGSSCSLLVIDRGNQAIREIQLHFDDCVYQYEAGFPLGILYAVPFSVIITEPEKTTVEACHLNLLFKLFTLYNITDYIKFDAFRSCATSCRRFLWLHACIAPTSGFRDSVN